MKFVQKPSGRGRLSPRERSYIEKPSSKREEKIKLLDEIAKKPEDELTPIETDETKNGLPVILRDEFDRMHDSVPAADGKDSPTFNFKGYVKVPSRDKYPDDYYYRDSIATNGLLQGEEGQGISVHTDGYDFSNVSDSLSSPESIREYKIKILIPSAMQKKFGVFCYASFCYPTDIKPDLFAHHQGFAKDGFLSKSCEPIGDHKYKIKDSVIEDMQKNSGEIVIELGFDPNNPLARMKAKFIHDSIVAHLTQGKSPRGIRALALGLEATLNKNSESQSALDS